METTLTINPQDIRGYTTQSIHTTELRYLMLENNGTKLQYRNAILKNGFAEWSDWKDVPVALQQKDNE